MRQVTVLVILGLAGGTIGNVLERDVNINIYDVSGTLRVAISPSYYIHHLKNGEFNFTNKIFRNYADNFTDFVVAFKKGDTGYTQGYYVRTGDLPKFVGEKIADVKPLYDYLNSTDFFALTPLATQKFAPDFFNAPFKYLHYQYVPDVDLTKPVPLVFLIPRTYFKEGALESLVLIAEYKIKRDGVHTMVQHRGAPNTSIPYDPKESEIAGDPSKDVKPVSELLTYFSPEVPVRVKKDLFHIWALDQLIPWEYWGQFFNKKERKCDPSDPKFNFNCPIGSESVEARR